MKEKITRYLTISIMVFFLFFNYVSAVETNDADNAPPILPEFINEGADKQIANWEKIFGNQFVDIVNAMEAVKTGDVQTFIESGINIIKVAPEILPRLGLDLIIPVNENYLGNIKIDPQDIYSGINIGGQKFEINGLSSIDIEALVLDIAVTGYNADHVQIRKLIEGNLLEISNDDIIAQTKSKLNINEGKISLADNNDLKQYEVNKLPSYALREVITRYKKFKLDSIELKVKDDRATYIIKGKVEGKILWIITQSAEMEIEYNAEKGLIERIDKPWWEILIF